MSPKQKVVTRIAPSPTGSLHVGTARTALFNFLFARKHGGSFILRIEDTDKERSKKEFEDEITSGLLWLGLNHDAFYRQSERTEIYTNYIQKLIESGHAYTSKESKRDDPGVEIEVVRLKNKGKEITFTDLVRGDITFDTTELGDFVIARSTGEPLYHLTVVVDDHDMDVTHVIRGEDHISNTPRQILILEALGFKRPQYVHIPLILAIDRSKLSKRNGATAISDYKENYLPEALINYLALLGWNPGTDEEMFTLPKLIKKFDITKVQKGGAVFDIEKLNSFNHMYIQALSEKSFQNLVKMHIPERIKELPEYNEERLEKIVPELKERIKTFSEIGEVLETFDFYFMRPRYEEGKILKQGDRETTRTHLSAVIEKLKNIETNNFNTGAVKDYLWEYATAEGRAAVLWPMRYALTGKEKSPDPFGIAEVLGKEETISRLEYAVSII